MLGFEWYLIFVVIGCCVGFMAGFLGLGGGGILVPVLVSIFTYQGIAQQQVVHLALGTALACMIVTSCASVRAHAQKKSVHWPWAVRLAPGIMLGAFCMGHFSSALNPLFIAIFFCAFMLLIAVQMLVKWQPPTAAGTAKLPQLLIVGIGIGMLSALATVGGGFLTLSYLTYKNVDIKKAIGTSAAIGLPIALAGTLGFMSSPAQQLNVPGVIGFVHWPAFVFIALSSLFTAPLGVRRAAKVAPINLKRAFAAISILLSAKMLYSAIHL